jgi:hypothetical protein
MQMKRHVLIATLLVWSSSVLGQTQYSTGGAALNYTGKVAPQAIKDQASQMAEAKAIEAYYARAGQSDFTNFDSNRDKILGNLDRYVLEATVVNEQDRTDVKQYSVTIRVTLNMPALNSAIKESSAVANVAKSGKSKLTFLFVARQSSDLTTYDPHVFKRVDTSFKTNGSNSGAENGTEGETVTKTQVSTNAAKTSSSTSLANASTQVESGGSTVRKVAEVSYRLFPISSLDAVFGNSFKTAGFRVIEATDVEPYSGGKLHVAAVQADYKTSLDLKSQTLVDVEAGLRNAQIPYLALGTLDVGFASPDPATGLIRVSVIVNAKIMDLTDTIPETVATVGPVQYNGLGPTETEAQTNALKLAAQNASHDLISQLTNAGIH